MQIKMYFNDNIIDIIIIQLYVVIFNYVNLTIYSLLM